MLWWLLATSSHLYVCLFLSALLVKYCREERKIALCWRATQLLEFPYSGHLFPQGHLRYVSFEVVLGPQKRNLEEGNVGSRD